MVLFKKWAKHKIKSDIYCVIHFLREKRHKTETKNVNNLFSIFDILNSRTEEIAWWPPVFKPDFYIFSNQQLRAYSRK